MILDVTPEPRQTATDAWRPSREPSSVELVAGAVTDMVKSPAAAVDSVRAGVADVHATAARLGQQVVGLVSAAWTVARPPSSSPLNADIGQARRFGMASARLDDLKAVRKAHGGTVNDVVLAVVAGALREWLLTRGESITSRSRGLATVTTAGAGPPAAGGGLAQPAQEAAIADRSRTRTQR